METDIKDEIKSHQEIGTELKLFMFHKYSVGSVILLPNGAKMWRALESFMKSEYKKRGYQEVITPQLCSSELWKKSGHLEHYKDNMFEIKSNHEHKTEDGETEVLYLKPMNCSTHCLIFSNELRSYRDLPLRIADFGCLHRNEASGALRGLNRLRKFSQDDAHIFCKEEDIYGEVSDCISFLNDVYKLFGFTYEFTLSTKPEKYIGKLELWDNAEKMLNNVLINLKCDYKINEGDGAFYGPKIDVIIKDFMDRKVQCGTIQLDFQLPIRFELEYKDFDGSFSRPIIVHRAILGSIERMMGILIEHFQGRFPLWLSSRQVAIVPIAVKPEFLNYCEKVIHEFTDNLDKTNMKIYDSNDSFNYRIRDAEVSKYNFVLIVGKKEIDNKNITFRMINHKREDITVPFMDAIKIIEKSFYDIPIR